MTLAPGEQYPPCPACDSDAVQHSGDLYRERPDGPELDPPAELLRCYDCWTCFRRDGVPYDEKAQIARWRTYDEMPRA